MEKSDLADLLDRVLHAAEDPQEGFGTAKRLELLFVFDDGLIDLDFQQVVVDFNVDHCLLAGLLFLQNRVDLGKDHSLVEFEVDFLDHHEDLGGDRIVFEHVEQQVFYILIDKGADEL